MLQDRAAPFRRIVDELDDTCLLKGEEIPAIGGYKEGNTYYIGEGNYRTTAALEIFNKEWRPRALDEVAQSRQLEECKPDRQIWDLTN
jgi:hypothetical protein